MKTKLGRTGKVAALALSLGIVGMGTGAAMAAESAPEGGGLGIGAIIFLALFALIILAQLLPGLVLFGSFLVALFTKARAKSETEAHAGEPR